MKNQTGITLLELLVAVAIFIVLVTLAVPAMDEYLARNRQVSQLNSLISALNIARSEAVKRGAPVSVCAANDDEDGCRGQNLWERGWLVFVDLNASGTVDANDLILRSRAPLGGGTTLRASGFTDLTYLTYFANGSLSTSSNSAAETGMFTICMPEPRNLDELARGVTVNRAGLIAVARDTDGDNIVNDLAGVEVGC